MPSKKRSSSKRNLIDTSTEKEVDRLSIRRRPAGPPLMQHFILTTNAIDRVEVAIQQRPGPISRCVYFGAPSAEIRRLYLEAMLAPYDCLHLSMDELIAETDGARRHF